MRHFRRAIVYAFVFSFFCIGGIFASRPAYAGVNIDNYSRTPLGTQISGSVTIGFQMASSQYGEGELDNVSVIRMSIHGVDGSVTYADIPFSNENQYPTFAPLSWTGGFAQGFQLSRIDLQLIYADATEGDESPIYEENGFTIIGQSSNESPGKNEVAPREVSVSVLPSQCSTDPNVYLVLHAREASQVRISNVPDFSDASWQSFETGTDYTVLLNWRVTDGDGDKTIYTQFRSPIGSVESDVLKTNVRLDVKNRCRADEDHAYIASQMTRSQRFDNPACIADYGHAKIGLYFAKPGTTTPAAQTQTTRISDGEQVVAFTDEDDVLDDFVVHVTHQWDEAELSMKPASSTFPFDLRAHIDAAEMGHIDDVLLVPHGTPIPKDYELDLKGRRELCETYELPLLQSGSLIQAQSTDVYLYGKDGKRHPFPEGVFASWYPTSTTIRTIPLFRLEKIPLGPNVAFRPGTLVRLGWTSARYIVDARQMLRPMLKESLIATVFGSAWMQVMRTLDVAYVAGYVFGNPIVSGADVANIRAQADSPDRWEAQTLGTSPWGLPENETIDVFDGHIVFLGTPYPTGDVTLRFYMYDEHGKKITSDDLQVVHGERVHNFILRNDLRGFQHIHPREVDGAWTVQTSFPEGGIYTMDFDLVFTSGERRIFRAPLLIGKDPIAKTEYPEPDPDMAANSNPYRVEVQTKKLVARQTIPLTFLLTKDGKPFQKIEDFLGEYGHLVVLEKENPQVYIHTHPKDHTPPTDGRVEFPIQFPHAGRFTLFVQFLVGGEIHTFPITVDVASE